MYTERERERERGPCVHENEGGGEQRMVMKKKFIRVHGKQKWRAKESNGEEGADTRTKTTGQIQI